MSALTATEVRVLSLLLERALALPADEREAFIAALPERQQVLVPRLRERLAQQTQAKDETAAAPPPPPKPRPPPRAEMRVGPYRLLEPLGGAEDGHVWRAERGEGAARKGFVLRLPPQPLADAAGAALPNAAEMQVVLLPAHPDIVRLVDAGIDAEGRFYRVLPHIEGLGIVEHAQRRGHGARELAQLMLQVARLVAHAHAEEVACGELGLASLRVDDEARVLLLDWGRGRALRPDTIAADLQGLGGVLQALLDGVDPGAPAAGDGPARAKAVNPGPDLARVLRRALRAPGVPPYDSVQAMVDELKLIPDFRPVPGAGGGTLHLARLFLRRHRLALGAGVLVGGLLLAVGNAGWRAYQRGQGEAQRIDEVQVFLAEALPGPAPGADGQPPDIAIEAPRLQRALEAARFGFPGDPVLRGQVITALGLRFRALGQPEQAQEVLQEAVTLLQGTARPDDPALLAARAALAEQLRVDSPGAAPR
ncbi:MAG: hypothetical protein Q8K45_06325 [Rubrivivax sp.]|nr:hypothetical protein [Rubrivivax sp.]